MKENKCPNPYCDGGSRFVKRLSSKKYICENCKTTFDDPEKLEKKRRKIEEMREVAKKAGIRPLI